MAKMSLRPFWHSIFYVFVTATGFDAGLRGAVVSFAPNISLFKNPTL